MCRSITCIILTVFNLALFVGGFALAIVGGLMKWNKPLVTKIFQKTIEFLQAKLGEQGAKTAQLALERIHEMAGPFAIVVFVGGIIIMCFATIAFIGLCCDSKIIMIVYAGIVGALFLAHVIILIIYFSKRDLILGPAYTYLQEAVMKYQSVESGSLESAILTIIMPAVGCCGFKNASDFNVPGAQFTHRDTLDKVLYQNIKYPVPCCNLQMELKDAKGFCPRDFTSENSFIDFDCKTKMDKQLFDKVALGSIVVLAVTGIVFILTIIHIKCTN